ncbi:HipA family kinase [Ligilactobacillus acidipiscis]|uniref:HipA family kinase n=1 Tax=Ligilactobacillus acidipiscis TaxID=89059 RepID=UPI0022E4E95C|nr:HipA family kinase [Ligilactobacillus acidipiscis]
MDKLYVDLLLNELKPKDGQSKPLAIKASNSKKYILKNQWVNTPDKGLINENAVFMQEMFVNQLALALGIPVPNFAILNIEQEFIDENKEYLFSYRLKPGLYFGTEFIPNVEDSLENIYYLEKQQGKAYAIRTWNSYYKNVTNPEVYADIIALDCLTLNGDRFTNQGNILIAKDEKERRKVFAIDFGHCFSGPTWDKNKIQLFNFIINNDNSDKIIEQLTQALTDNYSFNDGKMISSPGRVFKSMSNALSFNNGNPFQSIVSKIESLSQTEINKMLYNIPNEWITGSDMQRHLYSEFIQANKCNVRYVLNLMNSLNLFENNKGGSLIWLKDNLSGIR